MYFFYRFCVIRQIFTLSAVPVDRMPMAISECFSVLKPGGLLFFRDYGNDPYINLTTPSTFKHELHGS